MVAAWRESTFKLACTSSRELSSSVGAVSCMAAVSDLVVAIGDNKGRVLLLRLMDSPEGSAAQNAWSPALPGGGGSFSATTRLNGFGLAAGKGAGPDDFKRIVLARPVTLFEVVLMSSKLWSPACNAGCMFDNVRWIVAQHDAGPVCTWSYCACSPCAVMSSLCKPASMCHLSTI